MDYNSAKIFIYVVKNGSFSGAAKELKTPVSTVSRKVSELEEQLKARLLERSTRHLRLTDAGMAFHDYAARSIEAIDNGLLELQEKNETISGTLRIELPPSFEPWWPVIVNFQQEYPNVKIKVVHSTAQLDFIEDGIDVAIRFGEIKNETVVARKIATSQRKLVATPDFIDQFGTPTSPCDLINFRCITMGDIHSDTIWELGGSLVKVSPYAISNDFLFVKYFALSSQGIANVPPGYYTQAIKEGTLVQVLPNYPLPIFDVNIVYTSRKQLSKITRTFIDYSIQYAVDNQSSLWDPVTSM